LAAVCGDDRRVAFVRELTKRFEEVWRGTLADAVAHVAGHEPRGEWVLVVEGATAAEVTDDDIRAALSARSASGSDRRQAVREVTEQLAVARRRVYDLALETKAAGRTRDAPTGDGNAGGPPPAGR
jgi:16S rRNA (cytidine1402-2'-O)-methyltransferase